MMPRRNGPGAALVAVALVLFVVLAGIGAGNLASAAGAEVSPVLYQPPVERDVIDPFRPPAYVGAPGNRGLEYGNSYGATVRAAASGIVTFSGDVAGARVVSIEHFDGTKTTYTNLLSDIVDVDEQVRGGEIIGSAHAGFHFGVRRGIHYLDPQILLDASEADGGSRLVPAPRYPTGIAGG